MEKLEDWMFPYQLLDWAKANLNIMKLDSDMTDEEISRAMRWIGASSLDTIYVDGEKPHLGRIGINNILFVTLMEFPNFYVKYELAQWN
ncbi:MAG: hypothetical protein HQ588_03705 [Deltaproteobacteria bacterium]|nr:hypothetical protein [Deltaproteobacteria bacterium]